MKQLLFISLFVSLNISGIHLVHSAQKNMQKNLKLCFNDAPRNFGTTHFIIGYDEKKNPKRGKNKYKSIPHKHHKVVLDGEAIIDKDRISQSFFTTIHDLSPILLEIMAQAKKCLYVAAFTLTDFRIVSYLMDAHKSGVDVCVIADVSNMRQAHSKVQLLADNNIAVWCYKPVLNPNYKKRGFSEPFMHHKIIIGDDFVVTGSANLTKAGQKDNIENITILRDKQTVDEHHAEFERLKKYCVKCMPQIAA